jgi:hypothetical protein
MWETCIAITLAYFTFITQKTLIMEMGEMTGLSYKGYAVYYTPLVRLTYYNTEHILGQSFPFRLCDVPFSGGRQRDKTATSKTSLFICMRNTLT